MSKLLTVNDIAKEIFVTPRYARTLLSEYGVEPMDKKAKPFKYAKEDVEKFYKRYRNSDSKARLKNREQKFENERAIQEMDERIESMEKGMEQMAILQDDPYSPQARVISDNLAIAQSAKERFNKELPIRLLEALLYVKGYSYNEQQLMEDIEYDEAVEFYLNAYSSRSSKDMEVANRLKDSSNYLIKHDTDD